MNKKRKRIKCKFCDFICFTEEDYASHIEKEHSDMIPEDIDVWQFIYFLKTSKTHGNCVICKSKTTWNKNTGKYNRFCSNPKCKEKYVEIFKNRMVGKYGKTTLLNDPEHQKKMLQNRKISGEYLWRDHHSKSSYTGSYEKSFLEFLDTVLNFDPTDVITPSPHTYWYDYNGKKHFYIPDVFIPSLNLEIEIKDGGSNPNTHHKLQSVDKVKEKIKDDTMKKAQFSYLKITDKNNKEFLDYLITIKNMGNTEIVKYDVINESVESGVNIDE